jgi:tRNA(fMet)-specific endonuclease VapC
MAYLLDTNILSALLGAPYGLIAQRIERLGAESVFTSIVVAGEMRFGAVRKGSTRLIADVDGLLQRIRVAPLEAPADTTYGVLRTALEKVGRPIGANDLLIAAHALATDSVLVSDNVAEFSRVPGLSIENWLR